MSDEKWVTLTPEQVEALPADTWVRVCKGTTVIQGGIDSTDGHGRWMDVWIGDLRIKEPNRVEVREADVPKPDPQRLVSVRADDLTVALDAVESCIQADDVADRIRAALRGETS